MNKIDVRKSALKLRDSFDKDYLNNKSDIICGKFLELYSSYDMYLSYSPIRNEVDVASINNTLHSMGKRVYLPEVRGDKMCFRRYEGVDKLQKDNYGILYPVGELLGDIPVDIAIVPGVAFDRNLGRIGFGKGFYDKFLSNSNVRMQVALAYDFQIVNETYCTEEDVRMDSIITESETI